MVNAIECHLEDVDLVTAETYMHHWWWYQSGIWP